MVLRGDFDFAGFHILDRLVAAAMAEFQLEGLAAKCLAENLVSQTNPKYGNTAVHERFNFADDVIQRRRVAGAVRKEDSRRLEFQGILRGGGGRQDVGGKS